MVIKWNIHELIDSSTKVGIITLFFRSCSKKAQAVFDRTLDHLEQQDKSSWSRPYASPLGNSIYVIRFKDENRSQFRIFGQFNDAQHCFVMTLTGYEKDGEYQPSNYIQKSNTHRNSVQSEFFRETTSYESRCDHMQC